MPDLETLVARLRAKRFTQRTFTGKRNVILRNPDGPEAADALQSLEADNLRLKEALVALADGADKCAEAPHYIVQPFLAIYKKHGKTIDEARASLSTKERE